MDEDELSRCTDLITRFLTDGNASLFSNRVLNTDRRFWQWLLEQGRLEIPLRFAYTLRYVLVRVYGQAWVHTLTGEQIQQAWQQALTFSLLEGKPDRWWCDRFWGVESLLARNKGIRNRRSQ